MQRLRECHGLVTGTSAAPDRARRGEPADIPGVAPSHRLREPSGVDRAVRNVIPLQYQARAGRACLRPPVPQPGMRGSRRRRRERQCGRNQRHRAPQSSSLHRRLSSLWFCSKRKRAWPAPVSGRRSIAVVAARPALHAGPAAGGEKPEMGPRHRGLGYGSIHLRVHRAGLPPSTGRSRTGALTAGRSRPLNTRKGICTTSIDLIQFIRDRQLRTASSGVKLWIGDDRNRGAGLVRAADSRGTSRSCRGDRSARYG